MNNIITPETFKLIISDFVRISKNTVCPNCNQETKFIGESLLNGNWVCSWCFAYFPYRDNPDIEIETPFIKLTNQLAPSEPKSQSILLGDAPVDFPMNLTTGFLVPSYGYKLRRKRNAMLAVMDDFTRTGRIKSGNIWLFDLQWVDRSKEEYEALDAFADVQGFHEPFNYTDVFTGNEHICYFDSDISDAVPSSFDAVDFSIKITE
jgi:hypothetical protein